MTKYKTQQGFGLVEVLLALGIFALVVTGLLGVLFLSREGSEKVSHKQEALRLAEEGFIAVQHVRDVDYKNLRIGVFGVDTSSNSLTLSPAPDTVGIFTRTVSVIKNPQYNYPYVLVSVEWEELNGTRSRVEVDGIVSSWTRPQ